MPKAVIDASALIRAFVNEDGTPEAQELLLANDGLHLELVAPSVLYAEVAHSFLRHYRQKRLTRVETIESYVDFLDLPIKAIPMLPLALRDFEAALEDGPGAYDLMYVSIARQLSIPLITVDDRLLTRLPSNIRGYTPADALAALRSGTL